MAKLPGLVNYSDDEDLSSSSSVEDDVQQLREKEEQQQQQQQQSSSTKPPPTELQRTHQSKTTPPQTLDTNKDSCDDGEKDNSGKQEPSLLSSKSTLLSQETNSPVPSPTTIPVDRSTRLNTILTPKPLPDVENWGVPPEPQTDCDPDRLEKIQHFLSLRRSGHRLNEHLQRNKAFRNPRIYAKLVEFVDLNETGSNFPPNQFDPTSFPTTSYIDGILETQRQLAEEKAQAQAQGRSQISFTPPASSASKPPMDASAKFAAAMANAAKIANKIAKPTHPPPAQQPSTQTPTSSTTQSRSHDHSDSKRSSHRKWDRQDDRKRHHH